MLVLPDKYQLHTLLISQGHVNLPAFFVGHFCVLALHPSEQFPDTIKQPKVFFVQGVVTGITQQPNLV